MDLFAVVKWATFKAIGLRKEQWNWQIIIIQVKSTIYFERKWWDENDYFLKCALKLCCFLHLYRLIVETSLITQGYDKVISMYFWLMKNNPSGGISNFIQARYNQSLPRQKDT